MDKGRKTGTSEYPARRAGTDIRRAGTDIRQTIRRFAAAALALAVLLSQCFVLWPVLAEKASAETAGEVLSVRVQYFGERGDMIREKARFTRGELEAMGAQNWYYSNVTNVGTVMSMAAYGPEVLAIIQSAGIDPGSVKNITFRTTDGYTRNFTVEQHLSGGRYYYPNLSSNYERSDDGTVLTPLEGALADGYEVPSILALTFGATKAPGVHAEDLSLGTKETFRFCMGQSPLMEGQQTRPGQDGGDVSSMDSVHSIYGIDVTLAGSPVEGIGIDPGSSDMKVGSVTKLTILIQGDELFADDYGKALGKLTWSSSDPQIATVDQKGNVTIHKEGEVTITVQAANGMSASVVLNGSKEASQQDKTASATRKEPTAPPPKPTTSSVGLQTKPEAGGREEPAKTIHMREISLGAEIKEEPPEEADVHAMEEDTTALKEADKHRKGTAAGTAATALAACGIGGIHRFRRFRSIKMGWKR